MRRLPASWSIVIFHFCFVQKNSENLFTFTIVLLLWNGATHYNNPFYCKPAFYKFNKPYTWLDELVTCGSTAEKQKAACLFGKFWPSRRLLDLQNVSFRVIGNFSRIYHFTTIFWVSCDCGLTWFLWPSRLKAYRQKVGFVSI